VVAKAAMIDLMDTSVNLDIKSLHIFPLQPTNKLRLVLVAAGVMDTLDLAAVVVLLALVEIFLVVGLAVMPDPLAGRVVEVVEVGHRIYKLMVTIS
jgi:hypothetical protein